MVNAPRPQYTSYQRNFLAFEYHKYRGTRNFKAGMLAEFQARFPGARMPGPNTILKIWSKQMEKGTINNCNSKSSPGDSYSGRPRTARTPANQVLVKGVMDRDAVKVNLEKQLGEAGGGGGGESPTYYLFPE